MNLERVEELCLKYLGQTSNPIVPVSKLLAHCVQREGCAGITEEQITGFLRHHELVTLVEGPRAESEEDLAALHSMGIETGPRAVLKGRVPPRDELFSLMQEQLATMSQALDTAMDEAQEFADDGRTDQLKIALDKAKQLRNKIDGLSGS